MKDKGKKEREQKKVEKGQVKERKSKEGQGNKKQGEGCKAKGSKKCCHSCGDELLEEKPTNMRTCSVQGPTRYRETV